MSYGPADVSDIPTTELTRTIRSELDRRDTLAADGKCGYCKQSLSTHTCRYAGSVEPFHSVAVAETAKEATLGRLADAFESFSGLTFADLRLANQERQKISFRHCLDWTPTDWATALGGEAGETQNFIKKMRIIAPTPEKCLADPERQLITREREYESLMHSAAKELADVVTYADLLAARLGIDLGEAVRNKFNEISDRVGSNIKL